MILAQSISKIWTESFISLNKCMVKERWISAKKLLKGLLRNL